MPSEVPSDASIYLGAQVTDDELAAAAGLHERRTLRAVRAVESGGDPRAVRFEVHLWAHHYPQTVEVLPPIEHGTTLQFAERAAKWIANGKFPFTPKRSITDRWAPSRVRLESDRAACDRARKIDPETAVRCSSWGLYQELGAAILPLTPGAADEDVAAFDRDPEGASEQMLIAFCQAHPHFVEAANAHDWDTAARIYNGPSNVAAYSPKLAREYARAEP